MSTFRHSITIEPPLADDFTFLSMPENETLWQKGLIESRQTSMGPTGVGATGEDVRMAMGRRMVTSWAFSAYEPDRRFEFKVTKPVPFVAADRSESVPDGTQVELTAQPTGFARLLWPLISRAGRKRYEADLASLKAVLEAQV